MLHGFLLMLFGAILFCVGWWLDMRNCPEDEFKLADMDVVLRHLAEVNQSKTWNLED